MAKYEVRYGEHGGHCCGMRHLFGFYNSGYSQFWESVDKRLEGLREQASCQVNYAGDGCDDPYEHEDGGYVFEVVVTDEQLTEMPTLEKELTGRDFRRVYAFRNANSGNICYVYMCFVGVGEPIDVS